MAVTAPIALIQQGVRETFVEGEEFWDWGDDVMWIRRNGQLVRRYIAGTTTYSQHAGGNAWDIHVKDKATGDQIVAYLRALKAQGVPVGTILWWQRDHYDHIHVEGLPKLTQAQIAARYETGDDEEMEEFVKFVQQALVAAGYDLGNYGPNGDGVDGKPGPLTQSALVEAFSSKGEAGVPAHRHAVESFARLTTSDPI